MIFNEQANGLVGWCSLAFSDAETTRLTAPYGTHYCARYPPNRANNRQWERYSAGAHGNRTTILSEEVDAWLRAHVGWASFEYWEVDRIFYVDDYKGLPDLDVDWDTTFRRISHEERNWCWSSSYSELKFRKTEHAALFKLTWGGAQ